MSTILDRILERKKEEVTERSAALTLDDLARREYLPTRGFSNAMQDSLSAGKPAVISEVKKASPSKGVIRENFDPAEIAKSYAKNGASCLSVLTDVDYFQGSDANLKLARDACLLPVLRKDFIVDAWQIYESRYLGADCILLIVAGLSPNQVRDYYDLATQLGLDVLIEVHSAAELDIAQSTSARLIGINNRDLRSFETRLETTLELLPLVSSERIVITESGIHNAQDVRRMRAAGVNSFLVGEAFMRAESPGLALKELFELD
jgi:indole-3-glycerol phosphate synthase